MKNITHIKNNFVSAVEQGFGEFVSGSSDELLGMPVYSYSDEAGSMVFFEHGVKLGKGKPFSPEGISRLYRHFSKVTSYLSVKTLSFASSLKEGGPRFMVPLDLYSGDDKITLEVPVVIYGSVVSTIVDGSPNIEKTRGEI